MHMLVRMTVTDWLGIDKIQKLVKIVKEIGGIKATLKKRYLFVFRIIFVLPVIYQKHVFTAWMHRWLHHIGDDTPTENPLEKEKWVLEHRENTSIFADQKYIPYSTTRTKVEGWQPRQKSEQ
uniref:NADH dehydrogenase [ubiquinone] 1 alpha subcomplex subunit 12 n=1 Tax=Heterorhabditis bacteriophora TaxID=37862 RepID=A0A1I7XA20_HETBA